MRYHVLALAAFAAFVIPAGAQTPIDIQPVKELIPNGTLATSVYIPLETEAQFFAKLTNKERVNDALFGHYTMHGKKGKYISWFGIVRGITPAAGPGGEVTLLLQHRFFDGLTDSHIMLVAKSGDGDYLARLKVDRPGFHL
jgi:hypothetical protein